MAVFLGIDIGTSGTKTIAMREDGVILASATAEYPLMSPRPGWSEQNPDDTVYGRPVVACNRATGSAPGFPWPKHAPHR